MAREPEKSCSKQLILMSRVYIEPLHQLLPMLLLKPLGIRNESKGYYEKQNYIKYVTKG